MVANTFEAETEKQLQDIIAASFADLFISQVSEIKKKGGEHKRGYRKSNGLLSRSQEVRTDVKGIESIERCDTNPSFLNKASGK